MMKIPSRLRRGKRLYKKTIAKMFPELFQFERATSDSYVPNWRMEFTSQRHLIRSLVLSENSALDPIIPPEVIMKLLRENNTWRNSRLSPRTLPLKVARRLLRKTPEGRRILARFPSLSRKEMDVTTLLKRLLVVRSFLGKATVSRSTPWNPDLHTPHREMVT
jgi:hypothetical protein